MGGLVTRYLLEKFDDRKNGSYTGALERYNVGSVIMLGTPNHGTNISSFSNCALNPLWRSACFDMQPNSAFLMSMGYSPDPTHPYPSDGGTIHKVRYHTIGGDWINGHDGTVTASSPQLDGYPHTTLLGVCHVKAICERAETWDEEAYAIVLRALQPYDEAAI